ncbi:enoyl-CoA hydratase/isomerase family protein [Massilia cavernae]|uniref:Enoyl-CoA hydratase n=1 Tax=Massilia cavernae TaxID=2320864 RepID=A0A418Y0T2_9BURK|nr:enoyl-CoA hydratase-related protein [Massilia cavernae]RJG18861.1 enoyl-CoA hydratase [Massilia cavernae]
MDDTEILLDTSRAGIAVLTLDGPARLNALSHKTVRQFSAALDALAQDDTVRVLVLAGAGRAFCAGWDLGSALTDAAGAALTREPGVADYYRGQELFAGMVTRLRALDKVVIAAVNGAAVGAGFALTLAADVRLASRSASFHVGAVRIGLTAGECGISYHLPRLIGASRAFEVMLTGRPLAAEEAERAGLVGELVDSAELLPRALELAGQVLRNSPYSTRHTKRLMWANLEAGSLDAALELENRAQVLALMTDDFREAAAAFAEKRAPAYTGR